MNAPLRRNACPSLAAPMQTGDGLLVRLNTVSGAISVEHLAAVAEASARFGNGMMEVTRRGSLQIRGLTATSAGLFAEAVVDIGIDLRDGLAVETGPLAGLDVAELADPRPVAAQIRELAAASGIARELGPKVSVVVDGGGRLRMHDVLADIRICAVVKSGATEWNVTVGSHENGRAIGRIDDPILVSKIAHNLLIRIVDLGLTARANDLAPAAIEAICGHLESKSSLRAPSGASDPIGTFPLRDGRLAVGIGLPFGQATAVAIGDLALALRGLGIDGFRLAPGRALLAICPDRQAIERIRGCAVHLGFIVNAADPRRRIVACAGAPACASGMIRTKDIAVEVAALRDLPARDVIHISGCTKGCAAPPNPAFTLVGTQSGASIRLGASEVELARVAEREAAAAIRRVMRSRIVGSGTAAGKVRHGSVT